jgi:hypothetical protein
MYSVFRLLINQKSQLMEPMTKTKKKPVVSPLRVCRAHAARMLGMGNTKFGYLNNENVFTVITDKLGRSKGRRTYFMVDEIELYAVTNDPEKVRAFRREKGRLKP